MIPNKTDVAIIGSGVSAMVCALELRRHGFDVSIFEQSVKLGGYAHNFKRKGYTFDVSLHHIGGLEKGGLTYEILEPLGVLQKLEFEKRDVLLTSRFPDGTYTIPNSPDESLSYLSELFPAEKANLSKLFVYLKELKHHTVARNLYNDFNIPPAEALTAKHFNQTFDQVLGSFIGDTKLKAILGQLWMYLGLPPELASANYSNCIFTSSFLEGSYHVKGGGTAVADAMVEALEENGVKLFKKSGVKEIISENGNVKGVKLVNGEFIEAKYVVSNADPYQTIFELLSEDKISQIFKHRLNQMEMSMSIYSLYIGLDCPTQELNIPESNYFYHNGYDLTKSYHNSVANKVSETDYCLSNYQSSFNEFSQNNNGVISIAELTSAGDWFNLDKDEYKSQKEQVKDQLFAKYDKQFPGLRDHSAVAEFGTPRTMKRYSGNKNGSIYGFAQTINQSNNKRLANKLPIKGLFLSGSWTQAGGGYEGAMMGGLQTAHSLLETANTPWLSNAVAQKKTTTSIPDSSYLKYKLDTKIYPDDSDYTENAKSTAYLRLLDRSRVELGEQSARLRALKPLFADCHVNVYSITINVKKYAKLDSIVAMRTGYRNNTTHRAAVDQVMYGEDGMVLAEAVTDIMYVKIGGGLIELPDAYTKNDALPFDIGKASLPKILFTDKAHFNKSNTYTVYYEDTDAQGIVYNVSYVKFCEKAYWDNRDNIYPNEKNVEAKPKRIEIRFAKSGKLGDEFLILSGSRIIDDSTFVMDFKILKESTNEILSEVCIEYSRELV